METTITTCGWVLFGLLTAALTIFAVAFLYGCGFLGYRLSSRLIKSANGGRKQSGRETIGNGGSDVNENLSILRDICSHSGMRPAVSSFRNGFLPLAHYKVIE